MGQVVEPLVFGHGTGVSPIAVIVSTVFWTWLWGPLGLILAMPMTVCLAVLGRHVEGLEFFDVLLGDEPALTPEQRFYHRALSPATPPRSPIRPSSRSRTKSLQTYLDAVVLARTQARRARRERGPLDSEQTDKIAPRSRRCSTIFPSSSRAAGSPSFAASPRSTTRTRRPQAGLPRSRPPRKTRTTRPGPWSSGRACAGLGGRRAGAVHRRAHAARRGGRRHAGGGAEEARAGRQGAAARGDLGRPYRLARRTEAKLVVPLLSRPRQRARR